MKKQVFLIAALLMIAIAGKIVAQPTISSFTPAYGKAGDAVTINGTNFNTTAANNIVYFGSTKATVNTASSTQLSVTVPSCSKFGPITVTNSSTNLTGFSSGLFFPTFDGGGNNTLTISKAQAITVPAAQWFVKLADMDGDGKVELVALNQEGKVRVFPNNSTTANPSFNASGVVTITDDTYNKSMQLVDIDGDGKLDIITSGSSRKTNVHLNTSTPGSLSFTSKAFSVSDADSDYGFAVADIDMDGKPDILYFSNNNWTLAVLRNTSTVGSVSFAAAVSISHTAIGSTRAISTADVNNDGKPDAIIGSGSKKVEILINTSTTGSISFNDWGELTSTNLSTGFAYACDFDSDGNLDIVSAGYSGSGSNYITVWRNTISGGTLSFAAEQNFSQGSDGNIEQLSFADMNGDNIIDVLGGNYGMYHKWMRNTSTSGSISFSVVTNLNAGGFYLGDRRIEAGDVDGDGRPDYVAGDGGYNVYVFKNGSGIVSPSDAGITAVTAPSNPGCAGTQNVNVTLNNYSLNTLNSVKIDWSINGVAQTQKNLPAANLAGGGSSSVTLGTYNFAAGTTYAIIATTTLPNGETDNNTANDGYTLSNITINSIPTANAGNDQTIISGQTTDLTATGGGTYSWSNGGSSATISVNPNVNTTYTVTVTTSGCSATDQVIISVNESNVWSAGAHSNNWNTASNWAGNTIPTSSMDISIPANPAGGNFFPTVNIANAVCRNLAIAAGGSLNVPTGNTLTLSGYLDNSGSSNLGLGTVVFGGSDYQSIYGTNSFYNLTINNSNGVGLSGTSTVSNILKLTSGSLTTWGGTLTLKSTASKTAIISGTGTGNIWGDVNVQRYFGVVTGYYYLSSPVQGTFQQVANNMAVIGWGTEYKSGGWSNLWKYDETDISQVSHPDGVRMNGWVTPANSNVDLTPMEGIAVYTDANKTFTFNGWVNNGTINIPLTNTSSVGAGGSSFDDGWNLVGNPYPCPIDWDAASGWTKTNVANALYFYSASGEYKTYINGIGAPSGVNGIIASGQGFFVKAIDNGMLGVTNAVRVDNTNPTFYKKDNDKQLLRLKLSSNNEYDETVVYFDDNAKQQYNPSLDAFKLMNMNESQPNIYSVKANKDKLSINSQPVITDEEVIIPLALNVKQTGKFIINATEITNLPQGTIVYLVDNALNIVQNLNEKPEYRFNVNANITEGRFFLKINPKSKKSDVSEKSLDNYLFYAYASDKVLNVSYNNTFNTPATLDIYNLLGQNVINTQVISSGKHQYNLNTGCYIIRLVSDNKVTTKKITIE